MLSDTKLRNLKPRDTDYKVADRDGLYVLVTKAGAVSFRYNYRLHGRQETLVLGRYGPGGLTLLEARQRFAEARKTQSNNFDPLRLSAVVGAERCVFGMPFLRASHDKCGVLTVKLGSKTKLGTRHWVDTFNAAGIPTELESNMPLWLRCHVPLCVAFESIAVIGVRRCGGATWAEATGVARGAQAGFALIEAVGQNLHPPGKAWLHNRPSWVLAAILWLLSRLPSFRDLLARGENECCALVDVMTGVATRENCLPLVAPIAAMRPR